MPRLLLPLWLRLHCHCGQEGRVYLAEGWPNGADKLKSGMGLEHARHRSPINAFVHILSCLAACSPGRSQGQHGHYHYP